MSLSSVRSETALRSRLFSSSRSFRRFTCSVFSPPNSWRHREYVTSLTPIWRIASTMFWPCETRTSTCRSFATISSGLYRFLAIAVLLDVKDIPQVGPLQRGWIKVRYRRSGGDDPLPPPFGEDLSGENTECRTPRAWVAPRLAGPIQSDHHCGLICSCAAGSTSAYSLRATRCRQCTRCGNLPTLAASSATDRACPTCIDPDCGPRRRDQNAIQVGFGRHPSFSTLSRVCRKIDRAVGATLDKGVHIRRMRRGVRAS